MPETPPPGRRPPLSAEAITKAAVRIADAEGLEAVSIRRIAAELDARPMSLYNHFDSKAELIGSMADEVSGEVIVEEPLPEDWRQALTAIFRLQYRALLAHPWLVAAAGINPRFGPNSTKLAKQAAEAVERIPLEEGEVWAIHGTVGDYVLGHSIRAVNLAKPEDLEDVIPESDIEEVPELASLPDSLRSRASVERFEFGLQAVLDGVELRMQASLEAQRKRDRKGG